MPGGLGRSRPPDGREVSAFWSRAADGTYLVAALVAPGNPWRFWLLLLRFV